MRGMMLWGTEQELGKVQVKWNWWPGGSDLLMMTVLWSICESEMGMQFLGGDMDVVRVLRGL